MRNICSGFTKPLSSGDTILSERRSGGIIVASLSSFQLSVIQFPVIQLLIITLLITQFLLNSSLKIGHDHSKSGQWKKQQVLNNNSQPLPLMPDAIELPIALGFSVLRLLNLNRDIDLQIGQTFHPIAIVQTNFDLYNPCIRIGRRIII